MIYNTNEIKTFLCIFEGGKKQQQKTYQMQLQLQRMAKKMSNFGNRKWNFLFLFNTTE